MRRAAASFAKADYASDLRNLPIGVFDSGIGGLTVLEALLTTDAFNNVTHAPGPDGRPDFDQERFIYLGDQANMPYGNYPSSSREDFLRELVLKDAIFLLGQRYHVRGADGTLTLRRDKPPVKAIVITVDGVRITRPSTRKIQPTPKPMARMSAQAPITPRIPASGR